MIETEICKKARENKVTELSGLKLGDFFRVNNNDRTIHILCGNGMGAIPWNDFPDAIEAYKKIFWRQTPVNSGEANLIFWADYRIPVLRYLGDVNDNSFTLQISTSDSLAA